MKKGILSFIILISIVFTMISTYAVALYAPVDIMTIMKNIPVNTTSYPGENYWASATYKNYIYTFASATDANHHGLRIFDASSIDNITNVTDTTNVDLKGPCTTTQAPNQLICIQGDYMFVGMWTASLTTVRMFDLSENPASPKLLKTFTPTAPNDCGRVRSIFALNNYLYLAGESGFAQIDYLTETGNSKKISSDSSYMIRYKSGNLYVSSVSKVVVYNISTPSALSVVGTIDFSGVYLYTNATSVEKKCNTLPDFELLDSGYLLAIGYNSEDWMKRWMLTVDISDLSALAGKEIHRSDVQYSRLDTLIAEGNILHAGDMDSRFWTYDISNPTAATVLLNYKEKAIYNLTKFGQNFVATCRSSGLYIYRPIDLGVTVSNLDTGGKLNLTGYPANITGKVIGANSVEVAIGNYKIQAQAQVASGSFSTEIDSSVLKNGSYKAIFTAKAFGEEVSREIDLVVNMPPITDVVVRKNMDVLSSGNLNLDVDITNNYIQLPNVYAIAGLYKNGELVKKQVSELSLDGNATKNCKLSIDIATGEETGSYVKFILIKKNGDYFDVLNSQCILGAEPTAIMPSISDISSELKLNVDMFHDTRKVDINTSVQSSTGCNYLYVVYKPGAKSFSNLQHIDVVSGIDNASKISCYLPTNAIESQDYTSAIYVTNNDGNKYKAEKTFQYYGIATVNLALTDIKNATKAQVDNILKTKSNLFGIDTLTGSPYALLDGQYIDRVWSGIAGRNFLESGSEAVKGAVGLKNLFNDLVNRETVQKAKDIEAAAAILSLNTAISDKSVANVKLAFESFSNAFNIDVSASSTYKNLNVIAMGKFINRFINGAQYTSVTALKPNFDIWIALEYMNQTPYTEIGGIYDDVCNALGVVQSSKYISLNSNEKSIFFKELSYKKDFSTKQSFVDAISVCEDYVIGNRKQESTVSRGGGSSTGRVVVPVTPIINPPVVDSGFIDMVGFEWAETAVKTLSEEKIIIGSSQGKFLPNDNVTREEFVKMVVLGFGLKADSKKNNFVDVDDKMWSYDYINSAYANGIINGISEKEFNPHGNITREDMAVVIYNAMKKSGISLENSTIMFDDKNSIADYAENAVSALVKIEVINGVGDNKFSPDENAKRAQAAKMLYTAIVASKQAREVIGK